MKTSRLILILALLSSAGLLWAQTSPQKPLRQTAPIKPKPATKQQKPAKEEPGKQWLERAEYLTEEAREEEWRLHEQRPLLLARLAEAWWKYDIKKSRPWMDSAVGQLEFQPQNESVSEGVKRIHLAETVLGIVVPLDRSYADRLIKTVTEGVEHLADSVMENEDRREFSRLKFDLSHIADAAVREKNLDSADRVFRTLLKLKDGNGVSSALMGIRAWDADHADAFYARALEAARAGYEPGLIGGLAWFAYPERWADVRALPSEPLRQRLLDLVAEALLRVPQNDKEQEQVCGLWREGSRLLERYPPERMGAIQSVLDECKRRQPSSGPEKRRIEKKLETEEDYLKAAEEEPEPGTRGNYKSWAARMADHEGRVVRALEIMNSLTEEEREAYPVWVSDHHNYQEEAIRELYRRHDYPALQTLMDKSPTRPQTLLAVSRMLFAAKDESFALPILSEARRSLERTQVDEPFFYWSFLSVYARYVPSEAAAVLKETVIGINGIKPPVPDSKTKMTFTWARLSEDLRPLPITLDVLDLDPQYVTATIKLLEAVQDRTSFRLNLLRGALQRYQREKMEAEQKREVAPAKSKGRDSVAPSANH
jgi:hypothetical protein